MMGRSLKLKVIKAANDYKIVITDTFGTSKLVLLIGHLT